MKDTIDKAGLPLWEGGGRSGSYEALEAGGSGSLGLSLLVKFR